MVGARGFEPPFSCSRIIRVGLSAALRIARMDHLLPYITRAGRVCFPLAEAAFTPSDASPPRSQRERPLVFHRRGRSQGRV